MNGIEHVHECVGSWTDDGVWQVSPGDPIVRCKDCKYYSPRKDDDAFFCANFLISTVAPDDFCAWGETEEDER